MMPRSFPGIGGERPITAKCSNYLCSDRNALTCRSRSRAFAPAKSSSGMQTLCCDERSVCVCLRHDGGIEVRVGPFIV